MGNLELPVPTWQDDGTDAPVDQPAPTAGTFWSPDGLLGGLDLSSQGGGAGSLALLMEPKDIADIPGLPTTVSEGATLGRPVALPVADPLSQRGTAPDPEAYARQGEMAKQIISNPYDPDGNSEASGVLYNLGQQLQFHRGGALDAQHYGASTPYGNYAFGVYNAAAGTPLPDLLDWANTYGKDFSTYHSPLDKTYQSIPAENVQNITKGFNDYNNGIVRGNP